MSVRRFKSFNIPGRSQQDLTVAVNDSVSRSPSFVSCGWQNHGRGTMSRDDSYSRNNVGEIQDLLAQQVHITPRKVGRNLIAKNREETRRQSCPPTPERVRSFDSPQKRLMRRTFHLEDQLNKSANPDPRSPCLFKLNCNDNSLPENSNHSSFAAKNLRYKDDTITTKPSANETSSTTTKSGNVIKDFFLSLIYTVITLIKWFFITVACVILAFVLQHSYAVYQTKRCNYYTHMNMTSLKEVLSTEVYGQRLVTEAVINNIGQYLSDPDQNRPLVLSFYGWTGVGKNFVSGLIADHVRSSTGIKIIVPLHFPHVQEKDQYANQLKQWIISNTTGCAINLFIIDEIDKASWPIEETFRELVLSLNDFKLAERRAKVIMLLLSNKAASLVNRFLYDVLLSGGSRDDVKIDDVTDYVLKRTDVLSLDLWLSQQSALNQMLPFLPLQQPHVEECIVRDLRMKGRNASSEIVKQIVNSLPFSPKNSPLFSVTGCRKVSSAVDLHSTDSG